MARRASPAEHASGAPEHAPAAPAPGELLARRVAVAVLLVQAAGVVALLALGVRSLVGDDVTVNVTAVGLLVFLLLVIVTLGALARGVARGRRWASAPAITVQLFALFAVGPVLAGLRGWLGGALAALAIVGGIALVVQARSLPAPRRFDDPPA